MAVFYEYNREAAVSYARRWALGRNPAYMDYELWGGDCTNFISQCLRSGQTKATIRRKSEMALFM